MLDYNQLSRYGKVTYIFQHLQAFVSLIGIVGNILIISVFCRRGLRKYSYSFYSKAMAVSDMVVLSHSFRHWARFMFNADIDLVAPFFCTINEYQPYVTVTLSLWILMLISIDRLVTIVYPNRFKLLKQRSCQAVLVVLVTLINLVIFIEMPLNYSIVGLPQPDNQTLQMCVLPAEIGRISSWLLLSNLFLTAIVINNILNLKILVYIVRSRRKVSFKLSSMQAGRNRRSLTSSRDRKFATSTIGLNVCSFILKLPICVGLLAANYLDSVDPEIIGMVFTVNVMLATTDNAVSFGVNMTLNSVFYDEFSAMMGIRKLRNLWNSTSGQNHQSRRLTLESSNNSKYIVQRKSLKA